jgi:hypothetical protein
MLLEGEEVIKLRYTLASQSATRVEIICDGFYFVKYDAPKSANGNKNFTPEGHD